MMLRLARLILDAIVLAGFFGLIILATLAARGDLGPPAW